MSMAVDEFWKRKHYAKSDIIHPKRAALVKEEYTRGLRVWRDSPFTVTVQIRTSTEKTKRMTTVSITKQEALELAEFLVKKAGEIREE